MEEEKEEEGCLGHTSVETFTTRLTHTPTSASLSINPPPPPPPPVAEEEEVVGGEMRACPCLGVTLFTISWSLTTDTITVR